LLDNVAGFLYEGDSIDVPRVVYYCPRCSEEYKAREAKRDHEIEAAEREGREPPLPLKKPRDTFLMSGLLKPGSVIAIKCHKCRKKVHLESTETKR